MLLFAQILLTMFIAEMGDKTQLVMIAMSSRFKLKDIILGSALSIMALNLLAVGIGSVISSLIPLWLIKLAAGLAFFYFAWTIIGQQDDDEEESGTKEGVHPIFAVFGTFFLAELGDKTQLTAITFAANEGVDHAPVVWLACSIGLFAADLVGMMVGHLIKEKTPEGFLDKLAFVIFGIFGTTTLSEGAGLALTNIPGWIVGIGALALFSVICWMTIHKNQTK